MHALLPPYALASGGADCRAVHMAPRMAPPSDATRGRWPVPARRPVGLGVGLGGWAWWRGKPWNERPGGRVICSESGLHARSAASRLHPPPTVGAPSGRPRPHGMAAWDGGMGRGSTAWAGAPPSALGSGTGRVAKRERETSRRRVVGGLMRPQPHHKTTTCVEITTCMLCTCLWGRYIVEVCRVSDINIR